MYSGVTIRKWTLVQFLQLLFKCEFMALKRIVYWHQFTFYYFFESNFKHPIFLINAIIRQLLHFFYFLFSFVYWISFIRIVLRLITFSNQISNTQFFWSMILTGKFDIFPFFVRFVVLMYIFFLVFSCLINKVWLIKQDWFTTIVENCGMKVAGFCTQ